MIGWILLGAAVLGAALYFVFRKPKEKPLVKGSSTGEYIPKKKIGSEKFKEER